jgi:hypothetical protein
LHDLLVKPDILDVRVRGELGTQSRICEITLSNSRPESAWRGEEITSTHLIDHHQMVNFALNKMIEGDVLDTTTADGWPSPCFDASTILGVRHNDVSGGTQ